MQEIGKFRQEINVIPNNMEKYMSFMLGKHLVFLDSFQFMSSGLDRLVSNLPRDAFKCTSEELCKGRGYRTYGEGQAWQLISSPSVRKLHVYRLKHSLFVLSGYTSTRSQVARNSKLNTVLIQYFISRSLSLENLWM